MREKEVSGVEGRVGMDVFFFFQAEDGIRDIGVTGVQTCALPIQFFFDVEFDICVFESIKGIELLT